MALELERTILTSAQRSAIYDAAWRAYCSTQSSDHALYKADAIAAQLGVAPASVYEIVEDAVTDVNALLRQTLKELLYSTPEHLRAYIRKFR